MPEIKKEVDNVVQISKTIQNIRKALINSNLAENQKNQIIDLFVELAINNKYP